MKQFYFLFVFSVVIVTLTKPSFQQSSIIDYAPAKPNIPGPVRNANVTVHPDSVVVKWAAPATNGTLFISGYEIKERTRSPKKIWNQYNNETLPSYAVTHTLKKGKNDTGFEIYITPFQKNGTRIQYWPWTRIYNGASGLVASTIVTCILAFAVIKIGIH